MSGRDFVKSDSGRWINLAQAISLGHWTDCWTIIFPGDLKAFVTKDKNPESYETVTLWLKRHQAPTPQERDPRGRFLKGGESAGDSVS